MKDKNIAVNLIIALTAIFLSGCWYYSFTDKPYPDIETAEIVPFENQTTEYDLGDILTKEIIDEIDGSGLLKVRNRDADAELSGVINSLERTTHTYTSNETPEEYKITIRARVQFRDINKDKVLWESTFEGYGTYDATDEDDQAIEEAIALLIQRIIQRVREG